MLVCSSSVGAAASKTGRSVNLGRKAKSADEFSLETLDASRHIGIAVIFSRHLFVGIRHSQVRIIIIYCRFVIIMPENSAKFGWWATLF